MRLEIPYKFPSCNEYIQACKTNAYAGAQMKKRVQSDIGWYINMLPNFKKPVRIRFIWVEGNKKRDYDNVCFAKKFILDALVECGKLKDDNRKYVKGFTDEFEYGDEWKVILEITEATEDV